MTKSHLKPSKPARPSRLALMAPCMIPLKRVPASPDDVKMAVRFPISEGLYHDPRIHCTPTKQDASKNAWKNLMTMICVGLVVNAVPSVKIPHIKHVVGSQIRGRTFCKMRLFGICPSK